MLRHNDTILIFDKLCWLSGNYVGLCKCVQNLWGVTLLHNNHELINFVIVP